jgi:predicted secreted Zn-dependent protease
MRGAAAWQGPTTMVRLLVGALCLALLFGLVAACSEAVSVDGAPLEPIESEVAEPSATPTAEEPPSATPTRPRPTPTRIPSPTPEPGRQPPALAGSGGSAGNDGPLPPGFTEETVYVYYDIAGTTAPALRAQMEARGPGGRGSSHYDATSDWNIAWSHSSTPGPDGCAIGKVSVRTKVTLTMPRWTPAADAPQALRDRWNVFTAALIVHEEGHRQIAIEHGREIFRSLEALPPEPSCDALKDSAESTAKQLMDRLRREDELYDARTRHGLNQGTRFP